MRRVIEFTISSTSDAPMLEKYTLLRGIDAPSRLTKNKQTGASYEITHLESGLPGRSMSLASEFGAPPFCFAGFCTFEPDFTKFSSISALDEDTGHGKKYFYLFSNRLPVKQVELELKKLRVFQSQGSAIRHHDHGEVTSRHGELVYDLDKKDISAIYFCQEESFQSSPNAPKNIYTILQELEQWRAITSRIQALYLQREYYLIHQETLDLIEYSTKKKEAFRLQNPFSSEEIIQLWLEIMDVFLPVIAQEDPCLFLTLSIDEIKIYAVYGILIKNCLAPDNNYDTELKEQLNKTLEPLISQWKTKRVSINLDDKDISRFEEELTYSVKELKDKIRKNPTANEHPLSTLFQETRRLYSYVACFKKQNDGFLYKALTNVIIASTMKTHHDPNDALFLLKGLFESDYFLNPKDLEPILKGLFDEQTLKSSHISTLYDLVSELKAENAKQLKAFLKTQCENFLVSFNNGMNAYLDKNDDFFIASISLGISKKVVAETVTALISKARIPLGQLSFLLPYLEITEDLLKTSDKLIYITNPTKNMQLGFKGGKLSNSITSAIIISIFFREWDSFNKYKHQIIEHLNSRGISLDKHLTLFLEESLKKQLTKDVNELIQYDIDTKRTPVKIKRSIWANFYKSAHSVPYDNLKKIIRLYSSNNPEFGPLPKSAFKLLIIVGLRILLKNNGQMAWYLKKIAEVTLPTQVEALLNKILTRTLDNFPNAIFDITIQYGLLALHPEFKTLISSRLLSQNIAPLYLEKRVAPIDKTPAIMPLAQKALLFVFENYLNKKYNNEKGHTWFPILYKQDGAIVTSPAAHYEAFIEGQDGPFVYRSNHGLAHTARTLYLLHLVIQFTLKTANPELTTCLHSQMDTLDKRNKFITKLQIALAFYVTGREGEQGFGSEDYNRYRENSAAYFKQYVLNEKLIPELFKNEEELLLYVDCLANPYYDGILFDDLRQSNEKLKKSICIKLLLYGAHCVDLARLWGPNKIYHETVNDLVKGSCIITNSVRAQALLVFHEAAMLCHAMGDSVSMVYDVNTKTCKYPKIVFSNTYDTRYPKTDLAKFFAFSLDPIGCIELLNTWQLHAKPNHKKPSQQGAIASHFFSKSSPSVESNETVMSHKI